MQATSPRQFDATQTGEKPSLEQIRAGIWAFGLSLPPGHVPYTLTYLIEDDRGSLHVIDPGPDYRDNWSELVAGIEQTGHSLDDVESVIVSHMHPDHLGLADRLHAASGGKVVMHEDEVRAMSHMLAAERSDVAGTVAAWGVPDDRRKELLDMLDDSSMPLGGSADVVVAGGDVLEVPGRTLRVIHTPGHTAGSICLRDEDEKLLFTGDHVLPMMFPGIGLGGPTPTNPIRDYLESLMVVRPFDDHEVLPGHGYRFAGLAERCDITYAHHLRRSKEVQTVLAAAEDSTIWEVASQLTWTAGWENLPGHYLLSALAQTEMHMDFVRTGMLSGSPSAVSPK